jgi:hypothetical protein
MLIYDRRTDGPRCFARPLDGMVRRMMEDQVPTQKSILRTTLVVAVTAGILYVLGSLFLGWGAGDLASASVATLAIVSIVTFLRKRRSAFWLGCVIVGWGWLTIAATSQTSADRPVTRWIDEIHACIGGRSEPDRKGDWFEYFEVERRYQESRDAYRNAGYGLVALGLGFLGGIATHIVFSSREPSRGEPPPDGSLLRPGWREGSSPGDPRATETA